MIIGKWRKYFRIIQPSSNSICAATLNALTENISYHVCRKGIHDKTLVAFSCFQITINRDKSLTITQFALPCLISSVFSINVGWS